MIQAIDLIDDRQMRRVDVLVVGSGIVGSAAAAEFADRTPSGTTILIVEAGPLLGDALGRNVKNLETPDRERAQERSQGPVGSGRTMSAADDRARRVTLEAADLARPGTFLASAAEPTLLASLPAAAMSSGVGGMGAHWTCACPAPYGDERIPFIPTQQLDAWLEQARRRLRVTTGALTRTSVGDHIEQALTAVVGDAPSGREPQPMPLAVSVESDGTLNWSGTDVLLDTDRVREKVRLRAQTICKRLVVEGGRVVSARLQDLETGSEWDIEVGTVFVAGDSLRTPQLLWASDIRPDALGRYLNDHTELMVNVELDHPPVLPTGGDPLLAAYWIPYSDRHPAHGQVMQFDAAPVAPGFEEAEGTAPQVNLAYFIPKSIRAEDRMIFVDEVDFYGMPAFDVRYQLNEDDDAAIKATRSIAEATISALGRTASGSSLTLLPAGSSLHYQGTVRMGPRNDGTSVLDPSCKVWGLDNLLVGGNGVIPTATAGNPTLTSVALALGAVRAVTPESN